MRSLGLTLTDIAKAQSVSCEALVEGLVNYLGSPVSEEGKELAKEFAVVNNLNASYGRPGEVSTEEYDSCMIKTVEEKLPGYSIKVIKHDTHSRNPGGTTYLFVKK